MSLALVKGIFENQESLGSMHLNIGFEFNNKFNIYSIIGKLIDNNRVIVLNYDILFFRYVVSSKLDRKNIHNLYYQTLDKEFYTKLFENFKTNILIIVGLDLLTEKLINDFFKFNKFNISLPNFTLFISSLDDSFINLDDENEKKRCIVRSKLNIYINEKSHKTLNNRLLIYTEFVNINKLSKDSGIFEFTYNPNEHTYNKIKFDKLNVYVKEFKDIFEEKTKEEEQPSTTFKLSLNHKELQAKNEVILPYLNKEKPIITIEQDDLNELYDEDPDGDLDI